MPIRYCVVKLYWTTTTHSIAQQPAEHGLSLSSGQGFINLPYIVYGGITRIGRRTYIDGPWLCGGGGRRQRQWSSESLAVENRKSELPLDPRWKKLKKEANCIRRQCGFHVNCIGQVEWMTSQHANCWGYPRSIRKSHFKWNFTPIQECKLSPSLSYVMAKQIFSYSRSTTTTIVNWYDGDGRTNGLLARK